MRRKALFHGSLEAAGCLALLAGAGSAYAAHEYLGEGLLVGTAVGLLLYLLSFWIVRRSAIEVDDEGIRDKVHGVHVAWSEVAEIHLHETAVPAAPGLFVRRVALTTGDGREVSFCEAGSLPASRVKEARAALQPAVEVEHAALLLAVVAERTGRKDLLLDQRVEEEPALAPAPEKKPPGGIAAVLLGFKAIPKGLGVAWKLLKAIKLGPAAATFVIYAVLISWKFAAAMLLLVGFHECGHVFALWRCGIPVRGIYFVPFFGGAAVFDGVVKSHRDGVYISLNGPVWGTLLSCACLGAATIPGAPPALAAAGVWGALMNLFNLIPIFPLDGGRVLQALALSIGSGVGLVVVAASLFLGASVASAAGLELLWVAAFLGILELGEMAKSGRFAARAALLAPGHAFGWEEHEHLRRLLAPPRASAKADDTERKRFERSAKGAGIEPIGIGGALVTLFAWGVLGAILVAVVVAGSQLDVGNPIDLLR